MPWAPAISDTLWHVNYKINTDFKGFNFKIHIPSVDETSARAIAIRIGRRLKYTMPVSAEIVMATLNKDDHAPDSRIVPDVIGPGLYVLAGMSPPPSKFDNSVTALLVRFEHSAGLGITRKFAPIPDDICTNQALTTPIAGLVNVTAAPVTAPGAGADWFAEMSNLMQDIAFSCKAIKTGHLPGGPYQVADFKNAYVMRVGAKKGGRVFSP